MLMMTAIYIRNHGNHCSEVSGHSTTHLKKQTLTQANILRGKQISAEGKQKGWLS